MQCKINLYRTLISIASESGAWWCDGAEMSGVITGSKQFSFSRLLKINTVSVERVSMCKEFHTLGAATGKARVENTVAAPCDTNFKARRIEISLLTYLLTY